MNKLFFLLAVVHTFVACDRADYSAEMKSYDIENGAPAMDIEKNFEVLANSENKLSKEIYANDGDVSEPLAPSMNLKLIKKGYLEFESQDLTKTRADIDKAVRLYNGYISNETQQNSSYQNTRNLTVRIPSSSFDNFMTDLAKGVAHFDEKTINVSDVSEEFFDLQARLKTKKEVENRLIALLGRAGKMTEVLQVERQIGEVREEIERYEGRLKFLSNQVSLSTLEIRYYEVLAPIAENNDGFGHKLWSSIVSGWDVLLSILLGLVAIWPMLLILIISIILFRRWRRKVKKA